MTDPATCAECVSRAEPCSPDCFEREIVPAHPGFRREFFADYVHALRAKRDEAAVAALPSSQDPR